MLHESASKHVLAAHCTFAQKGDMPIILTAPHGGLLLIPGIGERSKGTKLCDMYTLDLIHAISEAITDKTGKKPYIVVALFHRKYIDANRSATQAYEDDNAKPMYDYYHNQITGYIKEIKARFPRQNPLLIDIHGQSTHNEIIFVGTQNKKTVKKLLDTEGQQAFTGTESVLGQLSAQGYRIFPPVKERTQQEYSSYNGGFTVYTYGSNQPDGVDAIQLEFGRDFRTPENLHNTAQTMAVALSAYYNKWQRQDYTI